MIHSNTSQTQNIFIYFSVFDQSIIPSTSGLFFYPQGVGSDPHTALALPPDSKLAKEKADEPSFEPFDSDEMTIRIGRAGPLSGKPPFIYPHHLLPSAITTLYTAIAASASHLFCFNSGEKVSDTKKLKVSHKCMTAGCQCKTLLESSLMAPVFIFLFTFFITCSLCYFLGVLPTLNPVNHDSSLEITPWFQVH